MVNSLVYKLSEACRAPGCPVCRLERQSVERYLDNQFYENVNSPKWREQLRLSLGFCREHAWLGVDKRLGDPLGFSIVYRDLVNSLLHQLEEGGGGRPQRSWASRLGQIPEEVRARIAKMLFALTPRKRCPACEHRDETTRHILSALVQALTTPEMVDALQASDGLCLPHLRQALEHVRDAFDCESLLTLHREKLKSLRAELDEFIRKNDYQFAGEGFGREGDAWLRAIEKIAGKRE